MRLLVTRPEPQASEWAARFASRGVDARVLPLLAILPPDDASTVAKAWAEIDRFDGVMFVSPAAVQAWLDARPGGRAWPRDVWVAAPGPGTARSLAALGAAEILAPAADAEQFDSDTLWSAIGDRDWRGRRILIVHGGAGRDDLARRWRDGGAVVAKLQAYRRGDARWTPSQTADFRDALGEPAAHAWLFSSGEAIDRLSSRAPADAAWSTHRALCTHPAISARARAVGFGRIQDCRPDVDAIVRALHEA